MVHFSFCLGINKLPPNMYLSNTFKRLRAPSLVLPSVSSVVRIYHHIGLLMATYLTGIHYTFAMPSSLIIVTVFSSRDPENQGSNPFQLSNILPCDRVIRGCGSKRRRSTPSYLIERNYTIRHFIVKLQPCTTGLLLIRQTSYQ